MLGLNSFKTKSDLINNTVGMIRSFTLENYRTIIFEDDFIRYLLNSVILTTLSLASLLLVASLCAYGLSRYKFRGRNFMRIYFLLE